MRTKTVKRIKLLKGEKLMFMITIIFGCIVMPASWVYTKALLTETNIELERVESKIESQSDTNEALSMQIDELASLDNIQRVASKSGLSYNNNNIKTISE